MGERKEFIARIADSSEMICSLKYEDVRGIPYNAFTREGIAALTAASSFFAILSILIAG